MARIALVALTASALTLAALPAQAAALFTYTLSGDQEVPPVATPASGEGTAVLDTDANTLSVSLSFEDLLGETLFAHIHCCAPPGANAPIAVTFTGFPVGVTEGVYDNIFDLLDPATYEAPFLAANGGTAEGARDALAAAMFDELAYVNIHSSFSPPGEIRGQVLVSEPAAIALFGLGMLALGLARRRG